MRAQYLKANGITHAEIWQTDNGYTLHLCSAPGIGFAESPEYPTANQCLVYLRRDCNCVELEVLNG